MKPWLLIALLVSMAFSSCEREKVVEPTNARDLIGNWKLVDSGSYQVTLVIEPVIQTWEKSLVQQFNLSGESAVNLYNSVLSYKAQDQPDISIAPVSSTKRAGPAEAMQFEQLYYTNLKTVNRYELTDKNRLKFYYPGGVLLYEKTN